MNVKKFVAANSRDALRLVREALGPDAVILSNRSVDGGIELVALASEDMAALATPLAGTDAASAHPVAARTQSVAVPAQPEVTPALAAPPRPMPFTAWPTMVEQGLPDPAPARTPAARQPAAPEQPRTVQADQVNQMGQVNQIDRMMDEIRSMRGMLEEQLAGIAWGSQHQREPARAALMREMLAAGFSASLARYLMQNLPDGQAQAGGLDWIKSVLARNLAAGANADELLEQGGVFALVGPTGVGKTTTTAKLAARCMMRHGAGKLALITTDAYRIGAFEQLRIYGKILGVMVHSVKDEVDLRIALDELKGKHTILIDTVGVSQRDRMVAEQVAMLAGVGTPVKRLLCLSATSTGETLNEVVRAYRGDGLAGCIMTKMDEAATIGNVLDIVIRQKLRLLYVANGQRVPEDLHAANRQLLVDQAFRRKRETGAFAFNDDELPLVMANAAHAMHDKGIREVLLG